MKPAEFAQFLLCAVLMFQLIHVTPTVSIFEYSSGEFVRLAHNKQVQRLVSPPLSVTNVAKEPPYEGMVLVGDVLLARNIEFLMAKNGEDYPYRGIDFSTLAHRPAIVGNFESSIPQLHVPTPVKQMRFSVLASYIPSLALSGFTHFSLANNHSLDFAKTGYGNTQKVLEQNQMRALGHPNQLNSKSVEFVEVHDKIVAVIAAHTLQQLPLYSELKVVFEYASARSDFQLVYVHWGTEYVSTHNPRQREAAQRFVDAGADVVVGHHPHVVQDIQLIDGVPVFYSLGNYIFDQYDSRETQEGLVLHLDWSKRQPRISLLPVTSVGALSQPRFMDTEPHSTYLENLADRSDPDLREFIRSGQIILDAQVASSSKVAMIST
jgi:poly-gamma-glutamate synthesis protein (capsule biosynthesis protein)